MVNYFLLGTCCCTRTHTKHRDTLEIHSNTIGNLEIFAIFSFVFRRARRTKTSKQNRHDRTNEHRASERGEFCRTSAKIELTPNAGSKHTFHSSCPACCTRSIVTRAEPRAWRCNRTAGARANMLQRTRAGSCSFRLLRFPVRFVFRSLRKPVSESSANRFRSRIECFIA